MAPCVALELLALATFVAYCLATRQARRAASQAVVLLVGGLVGVTALSAFMLAGQASLPLTWEGYFAGSASLEAWQGQWGLALMIVAGAWSAVLAYLQWAAT
jgi:hypothetical protein